MENKIFSKINYMIGIKCGMTRFFLNSGISIPVTIIKITNNEILYIKKNDKNKYTFQIGAIENKKNINKSILGHFNKYNISPKKILKSFSFFYNGSDKIDFNKKLTLNNFINYKKVNITGISKGKGFTGVIKRWNFKSQDASHGNSLSHRAPGSIGQNQSPGRVFKGKKMAGHKGCDKITIKNINISYIDTKNELLVVKGSVPGCSNKHLIINFLK